MRSIKVVKLYRCLEPKCTNEVAFEFLDHDSEHQLVCQKHSNKYKRRGFSLTRTTSDMRSMYQNSQYGFYNLRNTLTKFRIHNAEKFKNFRWNPDRITEGAAELLDNKDINLSEDAREVLIKLRNIDTWVNTLRTDLLKLNEFLDHASEVLKYADKE